jgi:hypothetical protein
MTGQEDRFPEPKRDIVLAIVLIVVASIFLIISYASLFSVGPEYFKRAAPPQATTK